MNKVMGFRHLIVTYVCKENQIDLYVDDKPKMNIQIKPLYCTGNFWNKEEKKIQEKIKKKIQ